MTDSANQTKAVPRKVIQSIHTAPEMPGRREFFTYRDLGVKEASGGRVSAKTMKIKRALAESTGWHYHTCEAQINYVINGWYDIVFEDGTEARVEAGGFQYVPGGIAHNEIATSDDVESIEICIPADMGTVAVEAPAWWVEQQKAKAKASG